MLGPARAAVNEARARFGLPEEAFLYYFAFDFLSFAERKNPLGALQAFRRLRRLAEGRRVGLVLKSLNALEDRLNPATFFRANRKHIINLQWIEKIEPWFSGGLLVTLRGGDKIEISRRQAIRFKDLLSL